MGNVKMRQPEVAQYQARSLVNPLENKTKLEDRHLQRVVQ